MFTGFDMYRNYKSAHDVCVVTFELKLWILFYCTFFSISNTRSTSYPGGTCGTLNATKFWNQNFGQYNNDV